MGEEREIGDEMGTFATTAYSHRVLRWHLAASPPYYWRRIRHKRLQISYEK